MKFREAVYRTPNRMLADTGHKTFDKQADYVGTGNVFSNVQASSFIRPFTEVECNGRPYTLGALREFDIIPFRNSGLPKLVEESLKFWTDTDAAILYEFKHYDGNRRVIHGYVITRASTHQRLATFVTGPTRKSHAVVDWCVSFITPTTQHES